LQIAHAANEGGPMTQGTVEERLERLEESLEIVELLTEYVQGIRVD
jgi:hypothetical protein